MKFKYRNIEIHLSRISLLSIVLVGIAINGCESTHENKTSIYSSRSQAEQHWLPYVNFDIAKFQVPPQKFAPYVRWWWLGNNVKKKELKRELKIVDDMGFAGVEIQPFAIGMDPDAPQKVQKRWYSWDSPSYYKKLRVVMRQAKKLGLIVDMTAGSGWPLTTPVTMSKTGMKMLTYADTVISGSEDKEIYIPLPQIKPGIKNPYSQDKDYSERTFRVSLAKLQEVIAAHIEKRDSMQVFLDKKSVKIITSHISNKKIKWQLPDSGKWEFIAVYSIPTSENVPWTATPKPSYVVNHFDSTIVKAAYNYLFGNRTGLKKFYGDPMRSIFNDSYELSSTVHYADHFFATFKKENGYSLKPWLPQLLKPIGHGGSFFETSDISKFVLTDQGKRIKYDFRKTISNIFIQQFIEASNHWAQQHGLLHRTQPYGIPGLHVIKAAGYANIPGTEQLYDGGTEGFIKLVTSGAHLYNRPIIAEESFVFANRAFMTTPQKIKALTGKAFTAGANQIIYHGFPYKLKTDHFGLYGWAPFISPYNLDIISSDVNESNPFWQDFKKVNAYIRRSQYVLRSGKPITDALIYDPGIDSRVGPNPKEALVGGVMKSVEPPISTDIPDIKLAGVKEEYADFWHVINNLFSAGITWDYVNNESLQQATMKNGRIYIRGNSYKAIVLPYVPYATLSSAKKLNTLSKKGCNILIVGPVPDRQPRFLNYKKRDKKTYQLLQDVVEQSHSHQLASAGLMRTWIAKIQQKIQFNDRYGFIRHSVRELKYGGQLDYLWNMTGQWQMISLKTDRDFRGFYWLNPSDGGIVAANQSRKSLSYSIPPYSSIILYAAKKPVPDSLLSEPAPPMAKASEVLRIDNWTITIGDTTLTNSSLFDWRSRKAFKYKLTEGAYLTTFEFMKEENKMYYLDLGEVYFTAKVWVNGQVAGKRIWPPYILDITDMLHSGENSVKVRVTPTLLNKLIGLGRGTERGDKYYEFSIKGRQTLLMPAGLVGPVTIKSL